MLALVRGFVLAIGVAGSTMALAEGGSVARDLDMRGEPRHEAGVVQRLPRGSRFELLARQGAWARIDAGGRQGWVLFFFLQFGEAPKTDAGREIAGVARLATGRPQGDITATIGARGLSEEQLRSAGYSAQEVARLESLAATPEAAAQFATLGGLSAKRVAVLPAGRGLEANSSGPASQGGN